MKQQIYSLLTGAFLTLFISNSVYAQPGTLDATFGTGGIVSTDIGTADDKGYSILQQADGKLVVAGLSNNGANNDFAVVRYNIDGSLDAGFGLGGSVTTPIGAGNEAGQAILLQPNGKILVAGFTSTGTSNDFALVRYNINGSLDNTFGVGGIVTTPLGSANDQGQSVALQTDGKILLAGFTNNGVNEDFGVCRYDTNGVLDPSFDVDGIVTTDFAAAIDVGRAIAVQLDGRIVVAGWSSNGTDMDFALTRYNTDGSLDLTFDTDGKVTTPIGSSNDQGYSLAIQADGRLVVAGISSNGVDFDFAVVRYNTNGSLDNAFDTDGMVTTDFAVGNDHGYSVAIQSDTRILVAGQTANGVNLDFGLARYNNDGSLDASFGTGGKVTTDLGGSGDIGWSVAIQADDKVIVTGSNNISGYSIGVTRYNVCDLIDTSIFVSGPTLIANATGASYQWLNCDSAYAPIAGQTNQSYDAVYNGNFAVRISYNNCADTSGCYNINLFALAENSFENSVHLYPNPTAGNLILSVNNGLENATVKLMNLTGQILMKKENISGISVGFDISEQAAGIYYLEIVDGHNVARVKVMKK